MLREIVAAADECAAEIARIGAANPMDALEKQRDGLTDAAKAALVAVITYPANALASLASRVDRREDLRIESLPANPGGRTSDRDLIVIAHKLSERAQADGACTFTGCLCYR